MANIIKLGSLFLDDCPADTEIVYNSGQAIRIGEAVPGKEISWVVVNNMLIADRCILTKISWDNLKANDLVFGKEVSIGGFRFTVRLLQVGAEKDEPNEWDAALDAVGEDDSIWHWKDAYFWVQEPGKIGSYRAYRGYNSARYWGSRSSGYRNASLGFRPALVPLNTKHQDEIRIGEQLRLWGGQSIVSGRLEEISDYEMVLSDWDGTLFGDFGSRISDGRIVIDQGAIAGAQRI